MSKLDNDHEFADDIKKLTIGADKSNLLMPPKFESPEAQRQFDKQRLAAAFRVFAMKGFDEGLAGHITVRDCIEPDTFWVNPVAIHFSQIRASMLVRVDHSGKIVEGDLPINNAAFAIHSRIHMARPDVNAIAHAHTTYGKAFSALGRKLLPITQDDCVFYDNHGLFDTFTGVVADQSEGDLIAEALGQGAACILQNHGLLTVGKTVDAATANFAMLEGCCQSQLLALAAGEVKCIPHDIAIKTRAANGSDLVTWGNFQPLYAVVAAQDPSFLE